MDMYKIVVVVVVLVGRRDAFSAYLYMASKSVKLVTVLQICK